jgi:hypothetical protein
VNALGSSDVIVSPPPRASKYPTETAMSTHNSTNLPKPVHSLAHQNIAYRTFSSLRIQQVPSYTKNQTLKMSNNYSTFQSTSFSFSSSTVNGQTRSNSSITHSDPSGTRVQTRSQEPGQAPRDSRVQFDAAGRQVQGVGVGNGDGTRGRIEDVTDREHELEKKEKEREYEERVEQEYAKREGGA